jgi:inorganic pyrophosphatase
MATAGQGSVIGLPIWQADLALVVVETPRGSANKLKYDAELGAFRLDRVLPAGMSFPFDFGFIPQTLADDGDPLDAIVLLDAPVYPGCVVAARLIGDLEAEQRDGTGPWERNDRLLAVAHASKTHSRIRTIADVDRVLLDAIGAFFVDYHRIHGEAFRVTGRAGSREALRAVRRSHRRYLDQGDRTTSSVRSA